MKLTRGCLEVLAELRNPVFVVTKNHLVTRDIDHWLGEAVPDRKAKVLNRIREMRDGKLNNTKFGERMKAKGIFADQIRALYEISCRREGLTRGWPDLTAEHFRRPEEPRAQLALF